MLPYEGQYPPEGPGLGPHPCLLQGEQAALQMILARFAARAASFSTKAAFRHPACSWRSMQLKGWSVIVSEPQKRTKEHKSSEWPLQATLDLWGTTTRTISCGTVKKGHSYPQRLRRFMFLEPLLKHTYRRRDYCS